MTSETQSKVIFKNANYTACFMKSGILTVQNNRTNKGKYLPAGSEANSWKYHIETALDDKEAAALCRAILNS